MAINQIQSYSKGTVLFASGDVASAVYLILEGTVIASRDREQVFLGASGILGDQAFFKESTHTYAAVCATDVKVLKITQANATRVFASQPRIAYSLLRELATKTTESEKMVFSQGIEVPKQESTPMVRELLPEGHPVFKQRVQAEHSEFLFTTNVECPICEAGFEGIRTRTSRLQLVEQQADFRSVYRNFEPSYYYLWVCPKCSFAYPERQYGRLSQGAIRRARAAFQEHPPKDSFEFDGQRTLHQVICSYYLAMRTFEVVGATPDQWANLWLRLVWIYEDLGERELALQAAEKAETHFTEAMSTTARSATGDQQLYIILGELNLRLDKGDEAFRNFHSAALFTGGDPRYKRMAADRIQDLRERRQA